MFDWLFKRGGGTDHASRDDVRRALDRITGIAPQLKLANRYEARLAPVIGTTLAFARELVSALPPPRDAKPDAWAGDAHLRAMFATPEDITEVIGQSTDVRNWFDAHIAPDHVYAVLSSRLVERRVLGAALEGGVMRSDVARTTIGFDDKRIRICDESDDALRHNIVQRVIEQLTLEAVSRVAEQAARRDALQEHRALLTARMQMLGRRGVGMSSLIASTDLAGDATRLQRDFEENEAALAALGSVADAIEMQLQTVIDLLAAPEALIHVTQRTLCINQMNLLVEDGSDECGAQLTIHLAHMPMQPPQTRAVEFVRIARRDMPPAGSTLEGAENWVL
ncbi:hypothetical protein AWB79_01928 [Caballeronia hypogeia]|uniref:Uncharacterized protein n=1 Tax=Caballeronia hypogeia TaxID=1777140 RepID=A0A158A4N0_9BURK|nr:hypothetical protein [Caballeronia hypogeia]SAK52772.1 hypothetical protein AWB79_01928 [Caballeronia hypogeia]